MELHVLRRHGWSIGAPAREFGPNRRSVARELVAEAPRRYRRRASTTELSPAQLAHVQRRLEVCPGIRGPSCTTNCVPTTASTPATPRSSVCSDRCVRLSCEPEILHRRATARLDVPLQATPGPSRLGPMCCSGGRWPALSRQRAQVAVGAVASPRNWARERGARAVRRCTVSDTADAYPSVPERRYS